MNNLPSQPTNFHLYAAPSGKVTVEVFVQEETVWLSQKALAELFGKERSVITKHLKNIFETGELDEIGNVQKMHIGGSTLRKIRQSAALLPAWWIGQSFFRVFWNYRNTPFCKTKAGFLRLKPSSRPNRSLNSIGSFMIKITSLISLKK
jgi:hypothetical protein